MVDRRAFFRRFAAIAAVIALAPEIAFARKLELPTAIPAPNAYLEFLPWEDQFANMMTQMLLVAKQNLANGSLNWP